MWILFTTTIVPDCKIWFPTLSRSFQYMFDDIPSKNHIAHSNSTSHVQCMSSVDQNRSTKENSGLQHYFSKCWVKLPAFPFTSVYHCLHSLYPPFITATSVVIRTQNQHVSDDVYKDTAVNMYNFCSSISYSSSLTVLSYSSRDGTSWEWGSCTCWSFRSTHASRTTTSTCRDSDQLAQCGTYISWVSTSMSWCHRFGSYGGHHWTRTPTASGRRKTDVHELSVGFPPTLYET